MSLGAALLVPQALWAAPGSNSEQAVWVQVRQAVVRTQPQHYAAKLSAVKYGDRLPLESEAEAGWIKVRLPSKKSGFLPEVAVTERQVVLTARQAASTKADPSEVVLAGKGFSKEVEDKYKQANRGVRFDLVDQMERSGLVSDQELLSFVKQGGLKE